tara:strand:- start:94 stop:222 length:129 start_codon:yes stop_codon:yes gene_type:complete
MESIEEMQNSAIYITQKSSFTKTTSHKKTRQFKTTGQHYSEL